jgi:polar amino acid transport system substrate-binding protein
MSKMKFAALAAMATASLLLVAGCASTTPAATPTASGNTDDGAIPTVSVDAAAAALLPAKYKTAGINVASDIPYAPMEMFDDENKPTGFDYDLSQSIAQKLGITISFNKQAWDSIIPSLQAGNHDIIMSGMNDTVERQANLDYVDYFKGGFAIVVAKGNPNKVTTLMDLCGQPVTIQKATVQGDMLKALTPQCTAAGKKAVVINEYPSDPEALNALRAGKGIADVMDAPIAAYAAQTAGKGQYFDLVTDAANPNGYEPVFTGIGVLKANKELTASLQAAVQSLIDDGTYGKILAKWNLSSFGVTTASINGTKK